MTSRKWVAGKLSRQALSHLDWAIRPARYGALNLCPLNLHSTIPSFYGQHCALRRESLDIAFHMGKNDTDREARKLYKTAQFSK